MTTPPTRSEIEACSDRVTIADTDGKLDLFCYTNCDVNDSDLIKNSRGIIFHGDKLVLTGFPYTPEFVVGNEEDCDRLIQEVEPQWSDCRIFTAYEGCVLRVFFCDNKWYVSTRRKLDANKSKWSSSKSFGEYFAEALRWEFLNTPAFRANTELKESDDPVGAFCATLDPERQYMFLLKNSGENRIVCEPPPENEPTVYHVGTYVNGVLDLDLDVGIRHPTEITTLKNTEDALSYARDLNPYRLQGLVVFAPTGQYKIVNPEYDALAKLRGNEPSVKFRYLHVRMNPVKNKEFRELYPEHVGKMEDQEDYIYDAATIICKTYITKYVKGLRSKPLPDEEFSVLKEAHAWYKKDRDVNRVTYDVILRILNTLRPTELNKIIKHVRTGAIDNDIEMKPVRPVELKQLLA